MSGIRTCAVCEANHAAILESMPSISMGPGTFEVAFGRWMELLNAAREAVVATAVDDWKGAAERDVMGTPREDARRRETGMVMRLPKGAGR